MDETVAFSTLAMTVALAVSRPRLGRGTLRVTPGLAAALGVLVLMVGGLLEGSDLLVSARIQWRPLLTLACVMVMTGVVKEVGAFDRLAVRLQSTALRSTRRAFDAVFVLSLITPSLLNNDAAILLLTPVVVGLAQALYPGKPRVLEAFAFAVFLAPGVAPLVISNPMNMIVAEFAGVSFNAYAATMVPISAVGAMITYAIVRAYYGRVLDVAADGRAARAMPAAHPAERPALALLVVVFLAYPVTALFGGPLWAIAMAGALGSLLIGHAYRVAPPRKLASHVSFDILAFLWGVFLVVVALRHVGVVDRLAELFRASEGHPGLHLGVVGVVAALGSAIVDNHPMSVLDMLALGAHGGSRPLLAALVGGDIGPRLLPIGSLAGLLWVDLLRRRGVEIGVGRFLGLGALVLVPTLAVSLLLLWLL